MERQVALITGAAQRIGAWLAQGLATTMGYAVAIHCRHSIEAAHALRRDILAEGGQCAIFQADLSSASACAELIDEVNCKFGRIDLLVNNASLFYDDEIHTVTSASWSDHLDINLTGPIFLSQAFARVLRKDHDALIVNILDQKVNAPNPDHFSYTASKLALAGLTPVLALAFAPRVRVCGIAPGITLQSGSQTREEYLNARQATPLGTSSSTEDIMRALRFLIETPACTGQVITIDGGESLLGRSQDQTYRPMKIDQR